MYILYSLKTLYFKFVAERNFSLNILIKGICYTKSDSAFCVFIQNFKTQHLNPVAEDSKGLYVYE